jgi:rhodanese-related sulfurtransferase
MNELELQYIESFQFENLVKNRIPFFLVHFNQDFTEVMNAFYAGYAQSQGFDVSFLDGFSPPSLVSQAVQKVKQQLFPNSVSAAGFQQIERDLKEKGLNKDSALVFLCETGEKSHALFKHFWSNGYGNAYWVKEGMHSLRRDLQK